jgi:acetyl-CoA carboxylase biotin carboxyl carrier protein
MRVLTFEQIKELVELVSRRGLGGLELERSGFRLKIDGRRVRASASAAAPPAAQPAQPAPVVGSGGEAGEGAARGDEEAAAAEPPAGSHVVTSPIVGTFYRASAPDADPFVEVGSRVKPGQVLCIIEAMKIMNEIESDAAGVVVEIYPANAQAVEFGEPLFALRPD